MIFAETRSFADRNEISFDLFPFMYGVEMTIANATSFVMKLDATTSAETKSVDIKLSDEMTFAEATSFGTMLPDSFFFLYESCSDLVSSWYEVRSIIFEFDDSEVFETNDSIDWYCCTKTTKVAGASKAFHASDTLVSTDLHEVSSDPFSTKYEVWFNSFDWSADTTVGIDRSKIFSRDWLKNWSKDYCIDGSAICCTNDCCSLAFHALTAEESEYPWFSAQLISSDVHRW